MLYQIKWIWSSLVVLASSVGFGVLVTAKFHTNPQCFYVFYFTQTGESVRDWSFNMLTFFMARTPLLPAVAMAFFAWVVLTLFVKAFLKTTFQNALLKAAVYASPALLLIIPALFWSDVPGTDWIVHQNFHDGRGSWPFYLLSPTNLGLLVTACLVLGICFEKYLAKWANHD